MITLIRNKYDEQADNIESKFKDLVLAYRVEIDDEADLPFVQDGDQKLYPGKELDDWLMQLEFELNTQRSLSGDGCYIDPRTGKVC